MTTPATEKNSRKCISVEEKITILDRLKSGEKVIVIAKDLKLNEATIRTIKKNENKIRNLTGSLVSLNKTARIKDTFIPKMEKSLMLWIQDCSLRNFTLNSNVIKEKAIEIYQDVKELESVNESHRYDFKASKGWFNRFKNRFSLGNVKIIGENVSADIESA